MQGLFLRRAQEKVRPCSIKFGGTGSTTYAYAVYKGEKYIEGTINVTSRDVIECVANSAASFQVATITLNGEVVMTGTVQKFVYKYRPKYDSSISFAFGTESVTVTIKEE